MPLSSPNSVRSIGKETIKKILDLENEVDMDYARKQSTDLLTDFLEILGENEISEAYRKVSFNLKIKNSDY